MSFSGLMRSVVAARRARDDCSARPDDGRSDRRSCGERLQKTTAPVREGSPGRTAAVSRRGSTRNTVKTLEDRIEAPRLFARSTAADVPRVGPELAIHKLILPATSDQRGRPRGADSSAFAERPERLESQPHINRCRQSAVAQKIQYDDASVPHLKPQETPGRAAPPQTRPRPVRVAVAA